MPCLGDDKRSVWRHAHTQNVMKYGRKTHLNTFKVNALVFWEMLSKSKCFHTVLVRFRASAIILLWQKGTLVHKIYINIFFFEILLYFFIKSNITPNSHFIHQLFLHQLYQKNPKVFIKHIFFLKCLPGWRKHLFGVSWRGQRELRSRVVKCLRRLSEPLEKYLFPTWYFGLIFFVLVN